MPEAPTPFALASPANACFHPSKPAALLPHCAALASPATVASATTTAAAVILQYWLLFMRLSYHINCDEILAVRRPGPPANRDTIGPFGLAERDYRQPEPGEFHLRLPL